MTDEFLFGVFPYLAVSVAGTGVGWRLLVQRGSVGTRSSQFLEDRLLFWSSVPWHYALLPILAAHALAVLLPGTWSALLGEPSRLAALEVSGLALAAWSVAAVALFAVRRLGSPRLRAVTTPVDVLVLALLLLQVATGAWIALTLRWGSVWYLHTVVPWLHSLARLDPRPEYAALLPGVAQLHAVSAFAVLALFPFSRLAHALVPPVGYLWRRPQRVVWERPRGAADVEPTPAGGGRVLQAWDPEDAAFWAAQGRRVASRNLWISIPALFLAFVVWMVWSVVVVRLPDVGFRLTTDQLFWLAAAPGLSGATLRIFYAFVVPVVGGRRWTAISTASLLLPALGMGLAVQDPGSSYGTLLVLALLCGLGGGNFASSMANVSFFFPRAQKGTALGLNAGLGNLGVSGMQFVVPAVIAAPVLGSWAGPAQVARATGQDLWLQNATFVWIPLIAACAVAAWFGMNDVASAKASFRDQAAIFRRKDNWLVCWLYLGTFGSFIGFSAGLPLLIKSQFPGVDPIRYAFLGPLLGALMRPVGGWLADRLGGARVTLWNFVAMAAAAGAVIGLLPHGGRGSFAGFLAAFLVLFAATGIGNGSVFRMIPIIFATFHERRAAATGRGKSEAQKDAAREAAAVIGFSSAVAAYGAFFVPRSFGTSMALTGAPTAALVGFITFYATCLAITWWFYARPGAEVLA